MSDTIDLNQHDRRIWYAFGGTNVPAEKISWGYPNRRKGMTQRRMMQTFAEDVASEYAEAGRIKHQSAKLFLYDSEDATTPIAVIEVHPSFRAIHSAPHRDPEDVDKIAALEMALDMACSYIGESRELIAVSPADYVEEAERRLNAKAEAIAKGGTP